MSILDEIKKSVGNNNVIVGASRTLDALKLGNVSKVFVTSNCKQEVKSEIIKLASLSKAEVVELDISNEELGTLYKKPFSISVVCFIKG